jgi:hypothetical protein
MAVIEGKGLSAPPMVSVRLDQSELSHLERSAKERDRHRNYKSASSVWRKGSTASPVLVGMVGEYAVEKFLCSKGISCRVLDEQLNDGDGGVDSIICGVTYQVKTSTKIHETCLIRRVNEDRQLLAHTCQRYVFCRWNYGDSTCDIRGWCERDTILEHGGFAKAKSKSGQWFNNEIQDYWLLSISDLVLLIKQESRRGQ